MDGHSLLYTFPGVESISQRGKIPSTHIHTRNMPNYLYFQIALFLLVLLGYTYQFFEVSLHFFSLIL